MLSLNPNAKILAQSKNLHSINVMFQNKKLVAFISLAGIILMVLPFMALAATKGAYLSNPLGTTNAPQLIGRIIKAALGVVGSVALLMFIYGGFMWLTSAGSPDRITKGKNVIVWAVIGLVVIFLSYTMVNFVINKVLGGKSTSPSGGGETTMACCYSSCSNNTISSPSLTESGSCDTKWEYSLSGGSCASQIVIDSCN